MTTTKITKVVSAEQLENDFSGDVLEAIAFVELNLSEIDDKPSKPILKHKHNSIDAVEYSEKLAKFEVDNEDFVKRRNIAREFNSNITEELCKYIKEISGLNTIVPADKRDKVWSKAWSDGHSNGYYEVYLKLCELIDIFD